MTSPDRWDELIVAAGTKPGTTRLRVAASSPHDLFIGLEQPGARRSFWYDVPTAVVPDDYRLPALRSIRTTVRQVIETPKTTRIELQLENDDLADVFRAMVNDLVSAIAPAVDDDSGLTVLRQRGERWRRLLETSGSTGLSTTDRRGLVGELIVFGQLLDAGGTSSKVAAAWTGPAGKHQDFQAAQAAIEVKATVTKQPQSLVITSERELDRTGIPHLYLLHCSLDERRGGAGDSLNSLVDRIRGRVVGDAVASALFDDGLRQYGYLTEHSTLYEEPKYTVRQLNAFEVTDNFPCITETSVPTGVGDISYRIQLAALQEFGGPLNDALNATLAP